MAEYECGRLEKRRDAIIAAARDLFIENGYERTTLGQVVERSGGSLATIYKLFENKDGLLSAVVFESAASSELLIKKAVAGSSDPATVLHRLARDLRDSFLSNDVLALVRVVIARSVSDVDFARRFYEKTASSTRTSLLDLFEHWQREGRTMSATPFVLTETFLSMFLGDTHKEAIMHGAAPQLSPEELDARTDLFLRGAGLL